MLPVTWLGSKLGEDGTPNGSEFVTMDAVAVDWNVVTSVGPAQRSDLLSAVHTYSVAIDVPFARTVKQNT